MENGALSSLDPNYYERIYVCNICKGISTGPICENDHDTDISNIDFEEFIKPAIFSKQSRPVSKGKHIQKPKICAVIPRLANANNIPPEQFMYLCPACGNVSPDFECKKPHNFQPLVDECESESVENMRQHRTLCSPVDENFVNDNFTRTAAFWGTEQKLYNVVQPVALYLPENFANMEGLGTGPYQVMAAFMETDSSKEENVDILPESNFYLGQNLLDWDESMDLAVLNMDEPICEILENFESMDQPNIIESSSSPVQIEPAKCDQTSCATNINQDMRCEFAENRRQLCCVLCDMEFLDLDSLVVHYLSHGNSTFICQFCLRRYTRSYWFKFHMKNHVHELPIVCPLCDESFLSTNVHEEHLKTVHNLSAQDIGINPLDINNTAFMCMDCGRWLKSESHLRSHKQMHDMVNGSTVHSKHQKTTVDQPILTNQTNKRKHASTMESTNTNSLQSEQRKPIHIFECNICLASIKSIEEVRLHLMTHDAQKLAKCEACNELFSTTAQMQQHKCSRRDLSLHACTDCSKVFSHSAGLSCHLRTAHQVDIVSCEKCHLQFKVLSAYIIHRARNH